MYSFGFVWRIQQYISPHFDATSALLCMMNCCHKADKPLHKLVVIKKLLPGVFLKCDAKGCIDYLSLYIFGCWIDYLGALYNCMALTFIACWANETPPNEPRNIIMFYWTDSNNIGACLFIVNVWKFFMSCHAADVHCRTYYLLIEPTMYLHTLSCSYAYFSWQYILRNFAFKFLHFKLPTLNLV